MENEDKIEPESIVMESHDIECNCEGCRYRRVTFHAVLPEIDYNDIIDNLNDWD